jgi:hypothetical protein
MLKKKYILSVIRLMLSSYFLKKKESQYKQVLTVQALRNELSDSKRDKIACVRIIEKDMKEDINLLDLKCEMDI